jgi:hypothetical protein
MKHRRKAQIVVSGEYSKRVEREYELVGGGTAVCRQTMAIEPA